MKQANLVLVVAVAIVFVFIKIATRDTSGDVAN